MLPMLRILSKGHFLYLKTSRGAQTGHKQHMLVNTVVSYHFCILHTSRRLHSHEQQYAGIATRAGIIAPAVHPTKGSAGKERTRPGAAHKREPSPRACDTKGGQAEPQDGTLGGREPRRVGRTGTSREGKRAHFVSMGYGAVECHRGS